MQYYKVDGFIENEEWAEEYNNRRSFNERKTKISLNTDSFNKREYKNVYCFISKLTDVRFKGGIFCGDEAEAENIFSEYLKETDINLRNIEMQEVTLGEMISMLRSADRTGYVDEDYDNILENLGLAELNYRINAFSEYIIKEKDKESVYKKADSVFSRNCFVTELDRIYAGKAGVAMGHPVHYFIETDDEKTEKIMSSNLIEALYANGRIKNKRYSYYELIPKMASKSFSTKTFDYFFKSNEGGTVIINCSIIYDEDEYASSNKYLIRYITELMKRYQNSVLTIFILPRECTKLKEVLFENLGNISILELKEEFADKEKSKEYLKRLAKEHKIRTDKALFFAIDDEKKYLAPELNKMFDNWYNNKLKTKVYPQYKDIAAVNKELFKDKPKGSAYSELMEMIGLNEAKNMINKALDFYKARKLFADKGINTDNMSMHMIFTGNPGTAKTTVARLFADIMRENGLLSKGELIEVGRADLVGGFVGWTAQIVKKKFNEAKGSVLFIDEAYSLVDGRTGSYGDEAINTIVQEMENHRDEMVVIFAGYSDKMEGFLNRNPGLKSRIAFHVPFADYDTDELCRIADLITKKKGLKLTDEALTKLSEIFDTARKDKDFGNGRFVRNMIEKSRMEQASRLVKMDFDSIKKSDLLTISSEDIQAPPTLATKQTQIGFRMTG